MFLDEPQSGDEDFYALLQRASDVLRDIVDDDDDVGQNSQNNDINLWAQVAQEDDDRNLSSSSTNNILPTTTGQIDVTSNNTHISNASSDNDEHLNESQSSSEKSIYTQNIVFFFKLFNRTEQKILIAFLGRRITRQMRKRLSMQSSSESQDSESGAPAGTATMESDADGQPSMNSKSRKYSVARALSPPAAGATDDENANFSQNDHSNYSDEYLQLLREGNNILETTNCINLQEHFSDQAAFDSAEPNNTLPVSSQSSNHQLRSTFDVDHVFPGTDTLWSNLEGARGLSPSAFFIESSRISDIDLREAGTSSYESHGDANLTDTYVLMSPGHLNEYATEALNNISRRIDSPIPVDLSFPKQVKIKTFRPKNDETVNLDTEAVDDDIIFVGTQPSQVIDIIDLCSTPGSSPNVIPTGSTPSASQLLKRRVDQMKVNAVIELNDSSDEQIPVATKMSPESPKESKQCPICFELYTNPMATKCGHVFCSSCITQAVKITKNCPICKRRCDVKQLFRLYF